MNVVDDCFQVDEVSGTARTEARAATVDSERRCHGDNGGEGSENGVLHFGEILKWTWCLEDVVNFVKGLGLQVFVHRDKALDM